MEDQAIMEGVATEIAKEWLRNGAEPRELRRDEDLYPADYKLAAKRMGRDLSALEKSDLRWLVSGDLEEGSIMLSRAAWGPEEMTWLKQHGRMGT